jgi:peroxygenase
MISVSKATSKSRKSPRNPRVAEGRESDVLPRTLKARSRPGDTALQRHVSFFDDNGDRSIDFAECTRGLKAIGFPVGVAEAAALVIVLPLSFMTRGSLLAMSIDIENIQRGKHDSDTGILDKRGRFNARRFEKVFGARSAVDRNGDRVFPAAEITRMVIANRETLLGALVSLAEWQLLLMIAADTEAVEGDKSAPALSVARIKSFFDGTLFYRIAREHAYHQREAGGTDGRHDQRPRSASGIRTTVVAVSVRTKRPSTRSSPSIVTVAR